MCVLDIADLSTFKCHTSSKLRFGKVDHFTLTLVHSERPKLHTILALLSAVGLNGR